MNTDKNQKAVTYPAGVNLPDYLSIKKITVPDFRNGNRVCPVSFLLTGTG